MFHKSIALFFTSQVQEKLRGKLKVTEAAFSYSFLIFNFYFNLKSYEKQEDISILKSCLPRRKSLSPGNGCLLEYSIFLVLNFIKNC